MLQAIDAISAWAVPALLVGLPLYGYWKGVPVYEVFVAGAREGLEVSLRLIPYLVAMFVALALFRESGALDLLTAVLAPVTAPLGIPREVIPLALVRPLSGSGALGVLGELLKVHGPDSYVGVLASTMQGSTDTTLYVLTVYFGSVGIKQVRHALVTGLTADLIGFVVAAWLVRGLF